MYCEYCEIDVQELSDVRRHILTVKHTRNRKSYELSKGNLLEMLRRTHCEPKNFCELLENLNLKKPDDVENLEEAGFFNINSESTYEIVLQMIPFLFESLTHHHLSNLPEDLRKDISTLYEKYRKKE